jgi:uncharacterized protein (DUF433 family)
MKELCAKCHKKGGCQERDKERLTLKGICQQCGAAGKTWRCLGYNFRVPQQPPTEAELIAVIRLESAALDRRKYARLGKIPGVMGGRMCLKGRRVTVRFVASRFFGGDGIDDMAHDYEAHREDIEQAIRLVANAKRQHRSCEAVFDQWQRKCGATEARP